MKARRIFVGIDKRCGVILRYLVLSKDPETSSG